MNNIAKDVLVNNVLPFLRGGNAQQETDGQRLSRWTLNLLKWHKRSLNLFINVEEFCISGAIELIPFDIFLQLADGATLNTYNHVYKEWKEVAKRRKEHEEEEK